MNRKLLCGSAILMSVFATAAFAQTPIVISDGPTPAGQSNSNHPTIITTDGPSHPAYSYPLPIIISDGPTELPYHTGSNIETTDGPNSHPVAKRKIVISDGPSPDPEASTLAPTPTVVPYGQALPNSTVERHIAISTWKPLHATNFFYVYSDQRKSGNHFIPSGWMGDFNDLQFNDGSTENPHSGDTCIKITYLPKSSKESGWAGIYWQTPANNWGDNVGGYNLTGKKRLTFWARGAKGGEVVSEFKMGGLVGTKGDSDSASTGSIVLSTQWKKYTIRLAGKDLSHIIGGFSWTANRDSNPNGMTFYLDNIRYE